MKRFRTTQRFEQAKASGLSSSTQKARKVYISISREEIKAGKSPGLTLKHKRDAQWGDIVQKRRYMSRQKLQGLNPLWILHISHNLGLNPWWMLSL